MRIPAATSKRERQARVRAAEERRERIQHALEQLPEVEAKKKSQDKAKARVSTTDPEAARVMKMSDGGFRPAYNGQLATDTESQVIVGVEVTHQGSDPGQLEPMVDQLVTRYDKVAGEYLVDGGFVNKQAIETVSEQGATLYAPVPKPKDAGRDPYRALPNDPEPVGAWRKRMGTDQAKAVYKDRASTAECVNAIARNRGLQPFRVRGLRKVKTVLLWYALAHNMMRRVTLRLKRAAQPHYAVA
jgi:hypothetical protein